MKTSAFLCLILCAIVLNQVNTRRHRRGLGVMFTPRDKTIDYDRYSFVNIDSNSGSVKQFAYKFVRNGQYVESNMVSSIDNYFKPLDGSVANRLDALAKSQEQFTIGGVTYFVSVYEGRSCSGHFKRYSGKMVNIPRLNRQLRSMRRRSLRRRRRSLRRERTLIKIRELLLELESEQNNQ